MIEETAWWASNGGFFGQKYIEGDDSNEGYMPNNKESLSERTKREIDGVLFLTKISKGKVLDIPCGYGRHSIELAKRGFSVMGMDINKVHLDKAIVDSHNKVTFLKKDMRNIGAENYDSFDLVINMFYSFGFFEKEAENEKALKEFYNALKKGGKFVLHTDVSPEMFKGGQYKFNEERNLPHNKKLQINEKYNPKKKRIEGSWTLISPNGSEHLTPYTVRIYSQREFEKIATKAGFKNIRFYGSFKGDNFDIKSSELIMIAQK